jgi:hypothetical protein
MDTITRIIDTAAGPVTITSTPDPYPGACPTCARAARSCDGDAYVHLMTDAMRPHVHCPTCAGAVTPGEACVWCGRVADPADTPARRDTAHETLNLMVGRAAAHTMTDNALDPDAGDIMWWGDDPRRGVYAAHYNLVGPAVRAELVLDAITGIMEATR